MKNLGQFFLLAYAISWLIWMPLYLPALGIKGLPVLPYHHAIGGLGPMIAAFIICFKEKRAGSLWKAMFTIKHPVYLLIALLSPFIILWLAGSFDYIVNHSTFNTMGFLQSKEFPAFSFITFLLYNLIFFGYGEETGWRGYALPILQTKYKPIKSAIILTVFWIIWHWPLFLYRPGYTEMGIAGIIGWILSMFTGSILLSWLYNGSKGSILVVALFHATVDIAFTADMSNANIVNYAGAIITIWGIITLLILRKQTAYTLKQVNK